jgi:hypothetical protein
MNCVILQPSYIPWRGYFHQVQKADVFVFYDDVQYDKHGWRHRNQIKTPQGVKWMSIPVLCKGVVSGRVAINEARICWDQDWRRKHLAMLTHSYSRAPHFDRYRPMLESFYSRHDEKLSDFTIPLTVELARELGIRKTVFLKSSELGVTGDKTDRLVRICRHMGATRYVSGPSAEDYIETAKFAEAGIEVEYMVYNYHEYPQMHPPYSGNVSILDLLFMAGPDAGRQIWGTVEGQT